MIMTEKRELAESVGKLFPQKNVRPDFACQ